MTVPLFKFIIVLLIFILVVHVIAIVYYWYWTYTWLDILMHFFGGFWLAAVFMALNSKLKIQSSELSRLSNYLITAIITLGFVALVGILWEFFEFLYDFFISSKNYSLFLQQGAADTLSDLFFDLLGGLIFYLSFYFFKNKNPDGKYQV